MRTALQRIFGRGCLPLVTLILAGCLAEMPARPRIFWPPPPEPPQFEFLGVFASRDDFAKTPYENSLEMVLGKPEYDGLRSPAGLFVDGAGRIYVLDSREKNLRVFDLAKRSVKYLFERSLPNFERPVDAALDSEGNLYVLDAGKRKILVFSSELKPLHSFGDPENLQDPEHLVVDDASRQIYVSDPARNRIEVFDPSGKLLFRFGEEGREIGQFHGPRGMAIDDQGNLYVADSGNGRIQVFDQGGTFLHLFGDEDTASVLARPVDLAFDSLGNLHVVDSRAMALLSLTSDGSLLVATPSSRPTNHLLGLSSPVGIHIDQSDRIIITDRFNHRFSVWQCLYDSYLTDHPVTENDLERLAAFSARLKEEYRKRMESEQQEVLLVGKKEKPPARIIVRLRRLDGEAIGTSSPSPLRVRCPGCGKAIDLAKQPAGRSGEDPNKATNADAPVPSREAKHDQKNGSPGGAS